MILKEVEVVEKNVRKEKKMCFQNAKNGINLHKEKRVIFFFVRIKIRKCD